MPSWYETLILNKMQWYYVKIPGNLEGSEGVCVNMQCPVAGKFMRH